LRAAAAVVVVEVFVVQQPSSSSKTLTHNKQLVTFISCFFSGRKQLMNVLVFRLPFLKIGEGRQKTVGFIDLEFVN
jgi:hypothetical protein